MLDLKKDTGKKLNFNTWKYLLNYYINFYRIKNMKKIIYYIALSSFLLSGNVYFSFDVQNYYDYHSDFLDIDSDNSFDNGSILLGYDHTVYNKDQFMLNLGCSFSIQSADVEFDEDILDTKTDFYSIYIMPNFQLSDKLNLWATLGHNSSKTTGGYTLRDGLMYGTGVRFLITEYIGLGLGYNVYNAEADMSQYLDGQYDWISSSSSVIHLKVKKLSLDLFYQFN